MLKGTLVNTSHVISVGNNILLRHNISDSYPEKFQDECVCVFLGSHTVLAMLTLLGAFGAIT